MYTIKKATSVSLAEVNTLLRAKLAMHPEEEPEYKRGDLVDVEGCPGIVQGADSDGSVCVLYLDENGEIRGPSYGWSLSRREED